MTAHMKYLTMVLALVIAGTFALTACNPVGVVQDERSVGRQIDDEAIESKVKLKLLEDPMVKSWDVEVKSYYGRVYLIGVVDPGTDTNRAVRLAESVPGVRSVTTYFLKKGSQDTVGQAVDDATIAARVESALIQDQEIKSNQIDIEVRRAHVLLFGIVSSKAVEKRAVQDAAAVPDVRKVKSFLIVQ